MITLGKMQNAEKRNASSAKRVKRKHFKLKLKPCGKLQQVKRERTKQDNSQTKTVSIEQI